MGYTLAQPAERGEFEMFPKLPLELRNMVWKEAAIVPQIVVIGLINSPIQSHIGKVANYTKPPAVLHSCRESRCVGLPEFEVTFTKSSIPGRGIYFNFDRDALFFDIDDGYQLLSYFFSPNYYDFYPRLTFPLNRKLLAMALSNMPSHRRLNARDLRLLAEPSHLILVRDNDKDVGVDAQNAAWIEEFWTCSNGHINAQGDVYPCPQVSALTYDELQTKLDKLST